MNLPKVNELAQHTGQLITSFYLVVRKETRTTREGKPYLSLKLGDRTGQIEARMWDLDDSVSEFDASDIVKVAGVVESYRGETQLKVQKLRKAREGEAEPSDFLPVTEQDVEELYEELKQIARSLNREVLVQLLESILTDEEVERRLKRAPGAKTIHHAVVGGLLEHIVSLCRLCRKVAEHYPEADLDLLLTGAILHDLGKIYELSYEGAFDYTTEGRLVGHIQLGLDMVRRKMDEISGFPHTLNALVTHMILSHHGRYEFGSPVLPQFREALLLHYLDDLDSKMAIVRQELAAAQDRGESGEWTGWNRAIERPLLRQERFLEEGLQEAPPAEDLFPADHTAGRRAPKK